MKTFHDKLNDACNELRYIPLAVGTVLAIIMVCILCQTARGAEIDLDIIKAIESGGDCNAYNPRSGARGAYQFTEIAWRDVQQHYPALKRYSFAKYAWNEPVAREFAARYFDVLKTYLRAKKRKISTETLICAYNAGLKYALRDPETWPAETKQYIKKYYRLKEVKLNAS